MDIQRLLETTEQILILRGGRTSGNWGHQGRPGKKGGSKRGGGFKAIGVKNPKGRGEVKRKAKEAKKKLTASVDKIYNAIPKGVKSSPKSFYTLLGSARKITVFGGEKLTLSQAQALSSKFEKQNPFGAPSAAQGKKKQAAFSKTAQAKQDKKKKKAGPPGKPQIGNLQKSATPVSKADATKAYDSFHKKATPEENAAMTRYQGTGYSGMNKHLRFGASINDADKENIKNLDKAIDKAPRLPKDAVLHRGAGFAAYESQLGADPHQWVGKVFEDKGYMSTTRDPAQTFPGVQAEVRAPKGTKTVYFGNLPGGPHNQEEEFLMARGTKMAITGVDFGGPNGSWVEKVYTEVIDQP